MGTRAQTASATPITKLGTMTAMKPAPDGERAEAVRIRWSGRDVKRTSYFGQARPRTHREVRVAASSTEMVNAGEEMVSRVRKDPARPQGVRNRATLVFLTNV